MSIVISYMPRPLTKVQKDILEDTYYKDKNLFGRDRLYDILREEGHKISRRQVMEWLRLQEIHQLYAPKHKQKTIKSTVLSKPHNQLGIDLIDMQNQQYEGYKYILSAIDLFSKRAYAFPLKNKGSREVVNAMKEILNMVGDNIKSIRSDRGSEFLSSPFIKLLEIRNIKQVLSIAGKPQSNGNIERWNGTIKRMINMALNIDNKYDWVSGLQKLVENYNNSKHVTTKKRPNEIDREGDTQVRLDVKENIKKKVQKKNEKITQIPYEEGDVVRISQEGSKRRANWSNKLYEIEHVYLPRTQMNVVSYKVNG